MKNTSNNKKAIKLWKYLKENPEATYEKMRQEIAPLSEGTTYINTLMKILQRGGFISVETRQDSSGKIMSSYKRVLVEPIIDDDVVCSSCNNSFPSKGATAKHRDLCNECTRKKYMTSPEVVCSHCSSTLPKNRSVACWGLFFHPECKSPYYEAKREQKAILKRLEKEKKEAERKNKKESKPKCVICGNETNRKIPVCSDECKKTHIIQNDAEVANSTDRKRSVSKTAKEILGNKCIVCGYDKYVHYHHIKYVSEGGGNNISNIIPLCPNHHYEEHNGLIDLYWYIQEFHKAIGII